MDYVVENGKQHPEDRKLVESLYRDTRRLPWSREEYEEAYKMLQKEHYREFLKESKIDLSILVGTPSKEEKSLPLPLPDAGNEIQLHYDYDDGNWIFDDGWADASINAIYANHKVGDIGVDPETGEVRRVLIPKKSKKQFLGWVSDCALHIQTETVSTDVTEFTFVGAGAIDKRPVKFTMPASDLAQPQKFKAALHNAFGAENKIGTLTFEMVQRMSRNIKHLKRVEVPVWDGSVPLIPGVDLVDNVEYRLSQKTPAEVYDGDMEIAKECLRNLLGFISMLRSWSQLSLDLLHMQGGTPMIGLVLHYGL